MCYISLFSEKLSLLVVKLLDCIYLEYNILVYYIFVRLLLLTTMKTKQLGTLVLIQIVD